MRPSITFLKNLVLQENSEVYNAKMNSRVVNESELFRDFYEKLKFPGYFGFNWDALWDCLRDLHWIDQKEINIVYDNLPSSDKYLSKKILKFLIEASNDWHNDEEHYLVITFPLSKQKEIQSLLEDNIAK